jgi:hypothetical protein
MENYNERKKQLKRELNDLNDIPLESRIEKYKNEIRFEIVALLQKSCPDNLIETRVFYDEWFKSLIGFYDPDMLMINLFLDKDFVNIFNYLMKTGSLKEIKKSKLSPLMDRLLNFSEVKWTINSIFLDEDNIYFLRSQFGEIIPDISNSDWESAVENSNPILEKYVRWLDSNLDNVDFENLFSAFILFVKIWNSSSQFSNKYFNSKATIFYHKINKVIEKRLNDLNSGVYIKFIQYLKERTFHLFSNIDYIPLLDETTSYNHGDGYLKQRAKNKDLYMEAENLNKICIDYTFIELMKDIADDTPEYTVNLYEKTINKKLLQFQLPSINEIDLIKNLVFNKNIEKIRINLFRNLYLFELN